MPLTDNLISFWKLEEASGTRADHIGDNDLTDTNTVTQAAGIVGNAAQFTAVNSESLSITDAAQSPGLDVRLGDYAVSCWVYPDTLPAVGTIYFNGCASPAAGQPGFWVFGNAGGGVICRFSDGSAAHLNFTAANGTLTATAWNHVVVNYDRDANMELFVNTVSKGTVAISGQAGDSNSTRPFVMGASNTGAFGNFLNGRIDAFGVWTRILTTDEIAELYNGGAGWEPSTTTNQSISATGTFTATFIKSISKTLSATGSWLATLVATYGRYPTVRIAEHPASDRTAEVPARVTSIVGSGDEE